VVTSDKRIKASLPTIEMAMKQGAKVMLMSHRGRPTEGEASDEFTLQPVADRLSELLGVTVRLEKNWLDGVEMSDGEVVLCENQYRHQPLIGQQSWIKTPILLTWLIL
jgi:phosphoglycerate kinase